MLEPVDGAELPAGSERVAVSGRVVGDHPAGVRISGKFLPVGSTGAFLTDVDVLREGTTTITVAGVDQEGNLSAPVVLRVTHRR